AGERRDPDHTPGDVLGVSDLLREVEALGEARAGAFQIRLLERNSPDVVEGTGDVRRVAELTHHGEAALEVHRSKPELALAERHVAAVVLGECEQTPVADFLATLDALVEGPRR